MADLNETTAPAATVIPVSLLVGSARRLIERHLGLSWVSGEISNCSRAASGHAYFVLKDDEAQVRCVLFRSKAQFLDFALKDGQRVEVRAQPTIYESRGEFQLTVETVRLSGAGALYEQFARRRARLEAAGWFAAARKRPLPPFPRTVGIVTSPRAAALSDVLATLRRRMPALRVIVYPAAVQGAAAAPEIASAIAAANAHGRADVLLVCRGGGSIEDLWAFNEDAVARAVFESRIPVVSGVGHEIDFTICDFVADVRAPTPTAAAALASPDGDALATKLIELRVRAHRATLRTLERRMQRLDGASRRLVHPEARLAAQRERLEALRKRLLGSKRAALAQRLREVADLRGRFVRIVRRPPPQRRALERAHARWQSSGEKRLGRLQQRIASLGLALKHLGPQAVLERGYSIVTTAAGEIVQDAARLRAGDHLNLRFARGSADAAVVRTRNDDAAG
jgi:exodeoxyribonuclease VII large subunit